MSPRHRRLIASLALALASLLPAAARATWIVPPAGYRAKDFTILKHDGQYHVFYIRHLNSVPNDLTEHDLGHAVSSDLWIWIEQPPVLATRPESWDSDHVWAPSIVERDSVFYLFYTGVADDPAGPRNWQRTGVATSSDLYNWNRMDAPILSCTDVPWTWCDSLSVNTAFRDPTVIPDPEHPGGWLMTFSTYPAGDTTRMVAALSTSDGDPLQWTNTVPLWASYEAEPGLTLVESPCLFRRNGLYYLFFTANAAQPLHWATAPALAESASAWTYRGTLSDMIGEDTGSWFASEVFSDGLVDYFAFVRGDRIDIRRMTWQSDSVFTLSQPSPFHVTAVSWNTPQVKKNQIASFHIDAVNAWGAWFDYEVLSVMPDGSETVLSPATIGAPNRVWVSTWSVDVSWNVSGIPDSLPDGTYPRLKLRTLDRTCESAQIEVLPATDPGLPATASRPVHSPTLVGTPPPVIKPLDVAEFGAHGLRVDLAAPAEARLEIFDVTGRRVRRLAERPFGTGTSVVLWDGRGDQGESVQPGLYFARLTTTAGATAATRFVLR